MEKDNAGILYVVGTPIGNLEDITLRAIETLKGADLIACEDTRVTKRLLDRYEISKPLISYHQHSKIAKVDTLIEKLKEGKNIALVTDAGTPGVSDPGNVLVAEVLNAGFQVVPIPGVSAVATIISVSGIDMQKFTFWGFPPHKKGRQTYFGKVVGSEIPVVYYDSVHRVVKNLELLQSLDESKNVIVGRELTKMFEEVVRGSVSEVIQYFKENPGKVKGEFVVISYNT
ncbi:MAG: 16S rRNA (cytidine(1402)-2'-O)-methyltransferase [Candidatus Moranbacteria bacterium]|nr:16S rRNA (cytidine(1402)-2'-O)-methyltransferase [Candidatus Moranbacteria bacterium]